MADCHFALGHYAEAHRLYKSALENYAKENLTPPPSTDTDFIQSKLEICEIRMKKG